MNANSTGAPTSHCLPLRPGTRQKYIEKNSGERLSLEVDEVSPHVIELRMQQPHNKLGKLRIALGQPVAGALNLNPLTLTTVDTGTGLVLTFGQEGLKLPLHLLTGDTIQVQPVEANPATGNRMHLIVRVKEMIEMTLNPGTQIDTPVDVLKCNLTIKDAGLGTVLANTDVWLSPGLGLVKSNGQAFGVFSVLDLVETHLPV